MIDASLLTLPWATLVTLASGYTGYFIANVGLREQHTPTDVTFSTLIFGLCAAMAYQAAIWGGLNAYFAAFPAMGYAFACGAYWRRYGRQWMYRFLRRHDISWSDGTRSAWQRMYDQRGYYISEAHVYLKDGTVLLSELPGSFEGQPCGSFVLGNDRDVLMYVTHEKRPGSEEWTRRPDVIHSTWGARSTWLPAEQIARVDIRRTKNRAVKPRKD